METPVFGLSNISAGTQVIIILKGGLMRFFILTFILILAALLPSPAFAGLKVCNQTGEPVKIAIGYYTYHYTAHGQPPVRATTSEGWWTLRRNNECGVLLSEDLDKSDYYYRAEAAGDAEGEAPGRIAVIADGEEAPDGEAGRYMFCIGTTPFTVTGDRDCEAQRGDRRAFNKIPLPDGTKDFTLRLTRFVTDDDDAPAGIALSLAPTTLAEGAGQTEITVTATVSGGTRFATDQTVTVSVAGDSATETADFAAVADFDIAIPAGAASASGTFALTPVDDTLNEADETVSVSGSAASGAPVTSTSLTIRDDDDAPAGIALSLAPTTLAEGAGQTEITVTATVSGGTRFATDQTVTVSVAGDSATETADFAAVADFDIAIPAGAASASGTFALTPVDDTLNEADETVSVSGSAASGAPVTSTSLTIRDDDDAPAGIALSLAPTTLAEGAGQTEITVTATVSGGTRFATDQTVTVSVAGDSATETADFAAVADFDIAIPAGAASASGTFALTPVDDTLNEADETVSVSGSAASGAPVTSTSLTIRDDDDAPAGIALSLAPTTLAEGAGQTEITVTATVSGGTRFATDQTVTVSVAGDSATETADFAAVADFDIAIPAGAASASGTFALTPVDDTLNEADETVSVSGSAASGAPVTSTSLTIRDDDDAPAGIALSLAPTTLAEGAGQTEITVTATVSGGTRFATDQTVTVSVAGDSATETADFAAVADFDIAIPAGAASASGTFALTPVDDTLNEADETVSVSGSAASGAPVTSTSLTIRDDDDAPAGIALSLAPTTLAEGAGQTEITVTATVSGGTRFATDQTVTVSVAGDSATETADFAAVADFDIAIPAGAASASGTFALTPVDDTLNEADETVSVSGSAASGAPVTSTSLTIRDDDDAPAGIALSLAPTTLAEGAGQTEITVTATVSGGTRFATDQTVTVSVAGDSATETADFAAVADFDIAIPAGAASASGTFALTPVDDTLNEADETVSVSGSAASGAPVTSTSLTIRDDDDAPAGIALSLAPTTLAEGAGQTEITVTATVSGGTRFATDQTVTVSVAGDSATETADFAAVADFDIAIPAGAASASGTFALTPVDDTLNEADETVSVSGSAASGAPVTSTSLTIRDDDDAPAGIALSLAPTTLAEGAGQTEITVTATVSGGTRFATDQTVTVSVAGDSATETADFAAVADFDIAIPAGAASASGTFALTPVDDTLNEADETVSVSGSAASGAPVTSTSLTIRDDDDAPAGIALSLAPTTLAEGAGQTEITVTATVSGGTRFATDQTVTVSVAGDSATETADFAAVADFDIAIPAGAASASGTFALTPVDDTLNEADETVSVSGSAASGAPVTSTSLTIRDDDDAPAGIALSLAPTTLAEGAGQTEITVTATVSGGTRFATDQTVTVSVAGDSATETADFAAVADFDIAIPAGAASASGTFALTPVDDTLNEADETVSVSGSAASGAPVTSTSLTIRDDDDAPAGIALSLAPTTLAEGAGQTEITVTATVSGGTRFATDQTVTVSVAGDSATETADFAAVADFDIAIPAGAASASGTFALTPVDDTLNEADETVSVSGSAASGAPVTSTSLTIRDDDDAPAGIALSLAPTTLAEGAGQTEITVTATVSGGTRFATDQTVTVSVAGDSATETADFAAVADFDIAIPAGAASASGTFALTPVDDTLNEADETVSVSGSAASGAPVTSTSLTIRDDDDAPAGIALSLAPTTLAEGAGQTEITVTATVSGGTRFATDQTVTVSVAGDSATETADFAAVADFDIAIPAGAASASGTFALTPVDDTLNEADETVSVSGSAASGAPVTSTSLTIRDDDDAPAGIALSLAPTTLAEGAGQTEITVTATVSGGTRFATDQTVTVSVAGDSATETADFAAVADFDIAIPAGAASASGTFALTPVDDTLNEADETVSVSGSAASGAPVTSTSLTIRDDDDAPAGIALSLAPTTLAEGAGQTEITVTATVSGGTRFATDQTVTVSVAGDSATETADFAAVADFDIAIPAGAASASGTFALTPVDDTLNEADETVSVSGSAASGAPVTSTSLTIRDDDDAPAGIALSLAPTTLAEGAGQTEITVTATVSGGTRFATDQTVTVSVAGDSATETADFAAVADFDIAIPAGAASASGTFALTPVDDTLNEADETVSVSGSAASGAPVTSTSLTIRDDDDAPAGIALSLAPTTLAEGAGQTEITVTATVSGGTRFATDQTVTVSVAGDSATETADFAAVADFDIAIPAGAASASGTFALTPVDDTLNEADETVSVSGSAASGAPVTSTSLTIRDDDDAPAGIALSLAPTTLAEGAGQTEITVTATVSGGTRFATDQTVTVSVAGDSATETADFAAVADFDIAIPAGAASASGTFALTPVDDTLNEADETVSVSGSAASGAPVTSTSLTIRDDDDAPAGIALSLAPTTLAEGAGQTEITVTATVSGGTRFATDQTVTVSVAGDSATETADFAAVADFDIAIPAGAASASGTFALTPVDDTLNEADETVSVSGSAASGAPVTSTSLTIRDDDDAPAGIALSLAPTTLAEGAGQTEITVTATVSGGTRFATDQTVTVSVAGDSATETADFAAVADFDIAIPAGAASASGTFALTPVDDTLNEADETVSVSGSAASGAPVTSTSLTIRDDDDAPAGIALSLAPTTLAEGAGQTEITVTATVSGGTRFATDQTVTVSVAGDSATETADFAAVADFDIAIPAGAASASGTFALTPVDDTLNEADETVSVSGSAASGAPVTSTSLTIRDDDDAPAGIALSLAPTTLAEGAGQTEITVTATVSGGTRFATDQTVTVSVAGDSATETADFAAVADFDIAIPAGAASASGTFALTPVDDTLNEADETVSVSGSAASGAPVTSTSLTIRDDDDAPAGIALSLVNDAIIPEMLRALTANVTRAVTGRVEAAVCGMRGRATLSISGEPTILRFLQANEKTLNQDGLDVEETLGSSSFALPLAAGDLMFWGAGQYRNLSGRNDAVNWAGDIFGAHVGVDECITPDVLGGLMLSRSKSTFSYTGQLTGEPAAQGTHKSRMTGIHPYVDWVLHDNLNIWATAGYSWGDLAIDDEQAGRARSDMRMLMLAFGGSGQLAATDALFPGGESRLRFKEEAMFGRLAVSGDGTLIDPRRTNTHRLRFVLEGSHEQTLSSTDSLVLSLELGVRHDGGDGSTGFGLELREGIKYVDRSRGLTVAANAHRLVAHQADLGEWGGDFSILLDPRVDGRGPFFSMAAAYGATSSGVSQLWSQGMTGAIVNDGAQAARIEAEVGYGARLRDGLLTTYGGISFMDEGARYYRLGSRFTVAPPLDASLEVTQRKPAGGKAELGVGLALQLRW